MMKQEFEELVGHAVSQECYDKIEYVYTYNDFFIDKQSIAKFYNFYDMNGIERMYKVTANFIDTTDTLTLANNSLVKRNVELEKENEKLKSKIKMFRNSISDMLK